MYFTVGALRSGGTLLGDRVIIGSELALADRTTVTDDLPEPMRDNLRRVFDDRTPGSIAQLIAHESVHTQQGPFASDLLSISLQEGVAEFVSTHALSVPSDAPAIAYGDAHADAVQSRFATVVGTPHLGQWLYSDRENDFGVRDLGYYVGYAIARGFHQQAGDPAAAITQMIDLDYQDAQAVAAFVDASGYFDLPVADLRAAYEHARPRVVAVDGLVDADGTTAPGPRRITFRFSRPIREGFRGFDYGPLGEDHILQIREVIGLSDDGMALAVGVNLRLGHRHQVLLSEAFRALDDSPLVPYLVDVTTSG